MKKLWKDTEPLTREDAIDLAASLMHGEGLSPKDALKLFALAIERVKKMDKENGFDQ